MALEDRVLARFSEQYGHGAQLLVRAPGRVNLIGEHTDYNDGFVLPMAIDRAVWIALEPREDRLVQLYSMDFDTEYEFSLDDLKRGENSPIEYVKGVAWALQSAGYTLQGFTGVMAGDVPVGSGLSSSAALEVATARAFASLAGFDWDPAEMARLCQKAENQWVGVNSGIMDQMISAAGEADQAMLIDCRSLKTRVAPIPPEMLIVVLDTGTRRGLVDSAYNERRTQCEAVATHFDVKALRDVSVAQLNALADELDPVILKRARHVITENERVWLAVGAMRSGNAALLGQWMNASHTSLRDDFEVSSAALDMIVEAAWEHPACLGARMTGAGFGGCAVALVKADESEAFTEYVTRVYEERSSHTPQVYVCRATAGASATVLS